MDPLSIVVATATLADISFRVAKDMRDFRDRYKEAPKFIGSMIAFCEAIRASSLQIRKWVEETCRDDPSRAEHLAPLKDALNSITLPMKQLEIELRGVGIGKYVTNISIKKKAKYAIKEESFTRYRDELVAFAVALHLLLDATSL
jgi:hypothetical protein